MKSYGIMFPIQWNFGDRPDDGFNGMAVSDPAIIYIYDQRNDNEFLILEKIDFREVVDEFIDSILIPKEGHIEEAHLPSAKALRDMLFLCANKIDSKIPK